MQAGALSCTATQDVGSNILIIRLIGRPAPEVPTGIVIGIGIAPVGVHDGAANT